MVRISRIFFYATILVLFILACFTVESKNVNSNSCISPEGALVDWSIIYTFDKNSTNMTNKFAYIDEISNEFRLYDTKINNFPPLMLAMELNSKETTYIIWNDDATNGEVKPSYDSSVAHSKGVLSFNSERGIYMIHSFPRFPFRDINGTIIDEFQDNFGYYSQTFFCMNIHFNQVNKILDSLLNIKPLVLLHNILEVHEKDVLLYKKIENLVSKQVVESEITVTNLETIKGLKINLFIKKRENEVIPWDADIPNFYKESFYVETWTRPELLPDVCKKGEEVLNMETLNILNVEFKNTNDHSKWAVAVNKDLVCYGDLNRTEEQTKRAGTIACFENKNIAKITRAFIQKYESCPSLNFLE
jgi:hypothetical protein